MTTNVHVLFLMFINLMQNEYNWNQEKLCATLIYSNVPNPSELMQCKNCERRKTSYKGQAKNSTVRQCQLMLFQIQYCMAAHLCFMWQRYPMGSRQEIFKLSWSWMRCLSGNIL
jgi:hypothetical protein